MRYSFLLLILSFGCQPKYDVPVTVGIDSNWQFKKSTDTIWRSATVPGNVFSDLLDHQIIEDPFIGNNEEKVQWVSETDWEYKTSFGVDEETLQKKHLELNFEGLDTYVSVFLNDSLILKVNNAFREWNVDVKPILQQQNELIIRFDSTLKYEEVEKAKLSFELPEGNRIFTRKAPFQYGWDWGPKLNTSGIWRPVKLVAWNDYKVKNVHISHLGINNENAGIVIHINSISKLKKNLSFDIYINDSLHSTFKKVTHSIEEILPVIIKNPKRWWPHNLGEPYLYDIKVLVKDEDKILDSISLKKGLRTIELVTEKDSIGESFYFKVNGQPIYTKGANYIPQNSFQNKVTDVHYEKLLSDVVDANMNMLRVWGGGIYENDIFYDLCDEKGILVWQDFMFACAMYPGDEAFLENVKREAIDNVKRLRNHTSIALWCGNNENSEGWHRWGWQDGRSDEEIEEIWNNYLKVFDSILPNTITKFTDTDYWESSPKYGRGNLKYKTEGDAHDWWIWHDGYPFEHWEENVPRFMSEFGFQSFPSYETIRYINQNDSIEITSEGFRNHQKHTRGFQIIENYMKRDFPVPESAEDYVYMSQLLQAYGITKGIEAQRRAKPKNMGTLYWQLNDCWPAVSWSSIDYFGNWKALHYKAKRSFEDVLISSTVNEDALRTFAVNDKLSKVPLNLKYKIIDFQGRTIWKETVIDILEPNDSKLIFALNLNDLNFDRSASVLVISKGDKTWIHYFSKPKDLKLKKSEIQKEISKTDEGFRITLFSQTLQKDVFLYSDTKGHFLDNYFDMLPNAPVTIHFKTDAKILQSLSIKSFNNFIR